MPKLHITSDDRDARSGPWPGPVPYNEGDQHYRGRAKDLKVLLDKMRASRLLLLTGYSGTGKTSFLRAAVVPTFRIQRARRLSKDGNNSATPFVLVVRDWLPAAQREEQDPDTTLIDAILKSIETLKKEAGDLYKADRWIDVRKSVEQDCSAMLEQDRTGSAYDYIARLTRTTGSLMLCMDQFEEPLRVSDEASNRIFDTIARLVSQWDFLTSFLLSFRQEFLYLFAALDSKIGNLSQVTSYLHGMPEHDVRVAIHESARSGNTGITAEAVNKLLAWMQGTDIPRDSASSVQHEVSTNSVVGPTSVDLLRLQALLQELYRWSSKTTNPGESVTITEETLDTLLERAQRADSTLDGPRLADLALYLFIERRVMPLPYIESRDASQERLRVTAERGLPHDLSHDDENQLALILHMRRATARIAPFLSSFGLKGHLKVQVYESQLIAAALRTDWDTLGLTVTQIRDVLQSAGLSVSREQLSPIESMCDPIHEGRGLLSGRVANRDLHRKLDAVKWLIDASREALDRLEKFSVVRRKKAPDGIVCELVHDGFGPALFDWSEQARGDPLDVLGAPIAQRGQAFRWRKLGGRVEQVCWRGCLVEPATGVGILEFENVEWINCDLRGTIFLQCSFKGGSFQECDFDGALFINCTFAGSAGVDKRFEFRDIRGTGLTFMGGAMNHVDFLDCHRLDKMLWCSTDDGQRLKASHVEFRHCEGIYQWTVRPEYVVCKGYLRLHECQLQLCDLRGLSSYADSDVELFDIHECIFDHCLVDESLSSLIVRSKDNRRSP